MNPSIYRFRFRPDVPQCDVEASLLLSLMAVEGLHGEAATRLDAAQALSSGAGNCSIDAGTAVGRDLAKIFIGFLRREFGEESFRVERVERPCPTPGAEAAR
jgi:hypothetical protein